MGAKRRRKDAPAEEEEMELQLGEELDENAEPGDDEEEEGHSDLSFDTSFPELAPSSPKVPRAKGGRASGKPKGKAPPVSVRKISVADSLGNSVRFIIKDDTLMAKILEGFCGKMNMPESRIRLYFKGKALNPRDNAKKVGIKDGETIEAMIHSFAA